MHLLPNRPITLPVLAGPLFGTRLTANFAHRLHFLFGTYERPVVNIIRRYLERGQIAFDIGANIGYLTLVMAQAVGASGRVFAFEPSTRAYQLLARNTQRMSRIVAMQTAIADHRGTEAFSDFAFDLVAHLGDDSGHYHDAEVSNVLVTTIDALVTDGTVALPDFIKVDVEGAEMRVFTGMQTLLETSRPAILVELHSDSLAIDVDGFLTQHGYSVRWRGNLRPEQRLYM